MKALIYRTIYRNLNDRKPGTANIWILYTTKYLKTITEYFDSTSSNEYSNYEKEFDSFYDDEENKLYLQFSIQVSDEDADFNNFSSESEFDDRVRCLVCMNVDENSELWNGDKGFAACYKR